MAERRSQAKTTAQGGTEKPDPAPDTAPDRAAIEAQLHRIREEMGLLGQMMRAHAGARLSNAQQQIQATPEAALGELQQELARMESEIAGKVRAHPLQSLGLAALGGLVLGLMMRR